MIQRVLLRLIAKPVNIRKADTNDLPRIAQMLEHDADHMARQVKPEFFTAHDLCFCFEDGKGPIFFVRLDPEQSSVRLHAQFSQLQPLRTAKSFSRALQLVKDRCKQAGASRLVFDSIDADLRSFCIKRFHFHPVSGTHDLALNLR
jgi:hypothetical protein